ncbi:TVP38/TMEM64 family protein [Roseibium sp.]|uniref:TVP38/TMEM64 family protein n=1 Tax=Roseibium sp. TaxID=1936156 RepID=UPI003B522C7A
MRGSEAEAMNGSDEPNGVQKPEAEKSSGALIRKWAPLAVLLALMILAFSQGLHNHLTLSALIMERQHLASLVTDNLMMTVVGYVALYSVAVALSFPGASLFTIAGGFLFGWVIGGFATVFGATVGAAVVFLIAKSSFGDMLTKRAGPFLIRLTEGFRRDAFNYLLFLRLTPIFPFWLVNIAPAVFQMPLGSYVLATFVGIIPGTFAFAFIGSGLDSVIEAQEAANPGCAAAGTCAVEVSALVTPQLVVAFFALGIASLIPVVLKRLRTR